MKSKAIVFSGVNRTDLAEFEQRQPRHDEVLIKVEFSCISPGTELRCLAGKEPNAGGFPFIPGYAAAGMVIESGSSCGVKTGSRVVCNGTRYAEGLKCSWGGHCQYAVCHEKEISIIPGKVSFEDAAMAVIMGIPMRGARLACPVKGETAVVVGLGLIGNCSARIFSSLGTKVHAFDLSSKRIEVARKAGIPASVITGSLLETARKVLPAGADIVVDCTGVAAVTSQAMELAKALPWDDSAGNGPRFVFQGSIPGDVSFPYHSCFNREMTLIFPRDRRKEDVEECLSLLSGKALSTTSGDYQILSYRDHQEAYSILSSPDLEELTIMFRWS